VRIVRYIAIGIELPDNVLDIIRTIMDRGKLSVKLEKINTLRKLPDIIQPPSDGRCVPRSDRRCLTKLIVTDRLEKRIANRERDFGKTPTETEFQKPSVKRSVTK